MRPDKRLYIHIFKFRVYIENHILAYNVRGGRRRRRGVVLVRNRNIQLGAFEHQMCR